MTQKRVGPHDKTADVSTMLRQAVQLHQAGKLGEASRLYSLVLKTEPANPDAQHMLGLLALQQGSPATAVELIRASLQGKPASAAAWTHFGAALSKLGQHADALAAYQKALTIKPDHTEALNNRASSLLDLERPHEALENCDQALALRPNYPEALFLRGNSLMMLGRHDEAAKAFDKMLATKPDHVGALVNRGSAMLQLMRPAEALASFERALAHAPRMIEALSNSGTALHELGRPAEALARHQAALEIRPDFPQALVGRGHAFLDLKQPDKALASYEQALLVRPNYPYIFNGMAKAALDACEWRKTEAILAALPQEIAGQRSIVHPGVILGYPLTPQQQLMCAQTYIRAKVSEGVEPLWKGETYRHDRIRIAYLSADFHSHATSNLMAELFEIHDDARFDVVALSFGKDDGSPMQERVRRAFSRFEDVRGASDLEAAQLIRDLEVDIAIDLKGYTQNARPGILGHRPAPIQVSYLGYPGTMGADFIDYILADSIVLPFDQQPWYSERIVQLPDCYQVNDSKRAISSKPVTRQDAGLPQTGFVFCCFNNNFKITAEVFDIWMRILMDVPSSVLWLILDNLAAQRNLLAEARSRGVNPARLVFADRVPLDQHLARHRLADLFLDTLPWNAHTTASDALWAGLPVLTRIGDTFEARVAASLLTSVGLPELIVRTAADYESMATSLAREPKKLQALRQRLAANRLTCPLFDAARFTRSIERAYEQMWERNQQGERPCAFSVSPARRPFVSS